MGSFLSAVSAQSGSVSDRRTQILHGQNGVGKTTLLRMLDGVMRLDFNPFRRLPFTRFELQFSTGQYLRVKPSVREISPTPLDITFGDFQVTLSGDVPGALEEVDQGLVEKFRKYFFTTIEDLTFSFIDTRRFVRPSDVEEADLIQHGITPAAYRRMLDRRGINPKARQQRYQDDLSGTVRRFIGDALLNYRTFFSSREPDLFPRILQHITSAGEIRYSSEDLLERLSTIRDEDRRTARLGLEADPWNYEALSDFLTAPPREDQAYAAALSALNAYIETLESSAAERALVADRLFTFENLMNSFFLAKRVVVNSRHGFRIETDSGAVLTEDQLSSGESHLLYLMVAALTTKNRGTIVAIDEPEMSMHLSWQRRLVRALVECASGAQPQFVFATHSPDIAADYPDSMVQLGPLRSTPNAKGS